MELHIDTIVSFQHVSEYQGTSVALNDLTFELGPGELTALIGPQRAGKTSVLRLLLGLAQPDEGHITVFGLSPRDAGARSRIGAVLTGIEFPATLKLGEIVELVRAHYPDPARLDDLVERCGFGGQLDRSAESLTQGDSRWFSILLAFAGNPSAVIMDMPTRAMDVGWRQRFWYLVREFTDDGGLALITTDELHEVEAFATRVMILNQGQIAADGTVEAITSEHGQRTVRMRAESLPDLDGVDGVEWHDGGPTLHTSDADTVVRQLTKREVSFEELEVRRPDLEEVLLALIEENE